MNNRAITLAAAILLGFCSQVSAAIDSTGGNFTIIASDGVTIIGGTNDVKFTWDETLNTAVAGAVSNATLSSDEAFFASYWAAHDVTIYGEGTYTIYDGCAPGDAACGTGNAVSFTVGAGQIGAHMLFDWPDGSTAPDNINIDVVVVWDQDTTWEATNPDATKNPFWASIDDGTACTDGLNGPPCVIDGKPNTSVTTFKLVSTDWDGDGTAGAGMTDGAFKGSSASFNLVQALPPGSPIANDFTVFTDIDTDVLGIDMLANAEDGDLPGTTLSLDGCSSPSAEGGTVTENLGSDTCDYLSPGVLAVNDSFTYTVFDGALTSAPGTVTIDIINEPPTCDTTTLTTSKDVPLPIDESDLIGQCTDPDGAEPLSVDNITVPPGNGTLSAALPPFEYIPNAGYTGPDSFQYTVSDTRGGITTATANIVVSAQPFGNFTMIDSGGTTFGGTNDIVAEWDGSLCDSEADPVSKCEMTMGSQSSYPFFGAPWTAHDIRVFKEGSYTFDTIEDGPLNLTIGAGQIGAHMLFDWGQPAAGSPCGVANCNIDVVLVWEYDGVFDSQPLEGCEQGLPGQCLWQGKAGLTPALDCEYELVSRDADGDGVPGARMVDGAFIGFRANFNINFSESCAQGEQVIPVSTISSPSSGGCTIGSSPSTPLRRMDVWLLVGFLVWLRVMNCQKQGHKNRLT